MDKIDILDFFLETIPNIFEVSLNVTFPKTWVAPMNYF